MRAYLDAQLRAALATFDGVPDDFEPEWMTPANPEHGDLATNAALQLARPLRKNPRQIAQEIVERLEERGLDKKRVEAIEIAGPGFLNVRFASAYLAEGLAEILAAGDSYGRTEPLGKTALVEYVSANPTGPLTVGHGRNAVLGDTIANLLDWAGYEVTREYYFNDAGRQMRVLGESVRARYEHLCHPDGPTKKLDDGTVVPERFPDEGYRGAYIQDIAQALYDEHGDGLLDAETVAPFKEAAEDAIFADIRGTLGRLRIKLGTYFNEHTLYAEDEGESAIDGVLRRLREAGTVYEAEGAVWFKTTDFGKDKDTVLVKSSGEPTYRLPDVAYHAQKLDRGFDLAVDVFGADHIATYPDVLSALEVLGYDTSRVDVVIYQFVTLVQGGQPFKMSTRKANYVTLDELMDEVQPDVVRFFFLMRSPGSHLEFDLDLAKEASEKNPVFYLQYAHARICSILRKAKEVGLTDHAAGADLSLLTHEAEEALIKELLRLPKAIRDTADAREPHRLATYLREVAVAFTQFYGHCHIVGEEEALGAARLRLAEATRHVLANGLTVLGVSAPDRM